MDRCDFAGCFENAGWLIVVPGEQKQSCYYHVPHTIDIMATGVATVVKIKKDDE